MPLGGNAFSKGVTLRNPLAKYVRVIIRWSKVRPRWPAARPPTLGRWVEEGYAAVVLR